MSIFRHIAAVALLLAAPVAVVMAEEPKKRKAIHDGSSFERAIIVNIDPPNQIRWEKAQIRKFHPDANLGDWESGIAHHNGRV